MIKWRCTLCGQCCKTYVPLVMAEDVKRIQKHQNPPLSAFVDFYRTTDLDGPVDESHGPQFFQTKHGKLVLGLSRVDLPDGEVGCVFLKNNICSIHPFKPLVCRQYPFQPQDPENAEGPFRLVDAPCFGKHAEDEIVDESPIRQDYLLFVEKQDEYLQKIKEWNDNPESVSKDIEDFLTFVGLQWEPNLS